MQVRGRGTDEQVYDCVVVQVWMHVWGTGRVQEHCGCQHDGAAGVTGDCVLWGQRRGGDICRLCREDHEAGPRAGDTGNWSHSEDWLKCAVMLGTDRALRSPAGLYWPKHSTTVEL